MKSSRRFRLIVIALMVLPVLFTEFLIFIVNRIYNFSASGATLSSSWITATLLSLVVVCCVAIALTVSRRVLEQLTFLTDAAEAVSYGKDIPHVQAHHVYDELLPLYQHLKAHATFYKQLSDRVKKLTTSPFETPVELRSEDDEFMKVLNVLLGRLHATQQVITAIHERNLTLLESLDERIPGSDASIHAMISEFTAHSVKAQEYTNHIVRIGSQIASLTSQELQDSKIITKRLSDVSHSVNKMAASIQHVAEHLQDQSFLLSDTSSAIEQTSQSVEDLAESITELKGNIEKNILTPEGTETTSSALECMNETIKTIEQDANTSVLSIQEALETLGQGQEVVKHNVEGIGHIQKSMQNFFTIVKHLGDRSDDVGEILEAISDIADHTNLLAINAAIISAHAGEHGRDFAVIADEIGKFAERTRESTAEIGELLQSFQEEFREAMQAMELTSRAMTAGLEFAHTAGDTFETFASTMTNTHALAGRIARNTIGHVREYEHFCRVITETERLQQNKQEQMNQFLWQLMQMIGHMRGITTEQTERNARIATMAENIDHLIRDISQVTNQHVATSTQVTETVNSIQRIVQRTSLSTEKAIRLSMELSKIGGNLAFTIGEFALSRSISEAPDREGVPLIGFIRRGDELFFDAMLDGIREEAVNHGFNILELNSHHEATAQVENVNWLLRQPRVAGIILCPTDVEVAQKLVQKGTTRGLPFVAADESIPITISVRSGNREGGRRAAALFMQHLQPNAAVGVLIDRSVESMIRRGLGFRQKAEQYPLDVVEMYCNLTSQEDIKNYIVTAIEENSGLQGIFLPSEDVTIAYLNALHEGRLPQKPLLAVGYDQTPQTEQAIQDGELLGAIFQHPDEIGKQAFQQLYKLISHRIRVEDLDERTIYIPTVKVTKEQLPTIKK